MGNTENLHRAELTHLERDEHVARWIALTQEDIEEKAKKEREQPFQPETAVLKDGRKAGRQHKPSGVNAAARELGVKKADAHRAKMVAGLSPEAKAAEFAGLTPARRSWAASAISSSTRSA